MKTFPKWLLLGGLLFLLCIGVSLWRAREAPQATRAPAAQDPLRSRATTTHSNLHAGKSSRAAAAADSPSAQELHQILYSSPTPLPPRRGTNEFRGPEELRAYAESVLFSVANKANSAFGFSPTPINLSNGTYRAKCYEGGIEGVFGSNRRYMVSVVHNELEIYADHWFREQVFRDPVRLEALSREPNHVTAEGALLLAERALKALGMDEAKLRALPPPTVQQQTWKERSDLLLPVFVVYYPTKQTAEEHRNYFFRFDIMGIVPGGFVSEFHNTTFGDEKFLQMPLMPGYREKARQFIDSPAGKKLR